MSASLKAAPATAAKIEDTTTRSFDRTVAGLKDGVGAATAGMEQAQASVKETMDKAMRTAEEMVSDILPRLKETVATISHALRR